VLPYTAVTLRELDFDDIYIELLFWKCLSIVLLLALRFWRRLGFYWQWRS
jgi:hypothetical protein